MGQRMTGSEALWRSLMAEQVKTVFGYPGGQIMPVYDTYCRFEKDIRHILVRHEQGAIHAAQGFARASGFPGVVLVTSGPGATNVVTGVADAMIDSTPVVVVAGQVPCHLLGTDAFQEIDLIGMTTPISKWSYQIRRPEDVAWALSRAFYIARTGRPGPVVLDFTKDAQTGMVDYAPQPCRFIRSYVPDPEIPEESLQEAARMIDAAKKPFVVYGQGILLSGAEKELAAFLEKGAIPAGSTLLGLGALNSEHPQLMGMLGMHGNLAPNVMTQNCDLLIAVGMRFDDRVTGKLATYARQARIIHIDIDASEIGKLVPVDLGIVGDAKKALMRLTELIAPCTTRQWQMESILCNAVEKHQVIEPEIYPETGLINPGEVVARVTEFVKGEALVVTDVGQNQMLAARYSRFVQSRSFISSGGLGTMGFGLPAAIGAKIGTPDRTVVVFLGDGGLQMTFQELGTIMQEGTGVKIVLLNNNWLGNVRMWQELFFEERYACTRMLNPDFTLIARAYGIPCCHVETREELAGAVEQMFAEEGPFLLDVHVREESMVFPMIPPGKSVDEILLNNKEWFNYGD